MDREPLGPLEREHPHLLAITDPSVLAAELERLRMHYNGMRLHEAIGYVTPLDEHEGRGDKIRAARSDGLRVADETPSLAPSTPPGAAMWT